MAPGWLLVRGLGAHRSDAVRSLLWSLLLSPAVLALPALALVWTGGVPLAVAAWSLFGLAALGTALMAWRDRSREPEPATSTGAGLAVLAPAALVTALAAVVLAPEGTRLSYHGILHIGVAAQIHAGVVPPDHVALGGQPIDFYWLYHWLLAFQVALSGLPILVLAPVGALVALFVYAAGATLLLARFVSVRAACWLTPAAAFAGNLLLPLVWAAGRWIDGPAEGLVFWPFQWLEPAVRAGDPRLVGLFAKFLNFSGFPLGLAAWALLLDELAPARRDPSPPRLGLVFLGLVHAVLLHTTTALGLFAGLPFAILATRIGSLRDFSPADAVRALAAPAAAFAAALLVTAPYLVSVASASASLGQGPTGGWMAGVARAAGGVAWSATPLAAAFGWALVRGVRGRRPLGPVLRFQTVALGVLLGAGVALPLPDHNEYKLLLMAALPAGVVLTALARDALAEAGRGRRRAFVAAAVLLGVGGLALTATAYARAANAGREDFAAEGAYLAMPGDPALERALRWVRERTPVDAIVVTKPARFGGSPVRAVSGRAVYALEGGHHTAGSALLQQRVAALARLFSLGEPIAPAVAAVGEGLDRPLFVLLVRSEFPDRFEALRRRLDGGAPAVERVHAEDGVVVYRLH